MAGAIPMALAWLTGGASSGKKMTNFLSFEM
jgi:hypothetical protein